jgi:type IV pilus assembly protein PilY1
MKALTAGFHRFSLGALLLAAPLALASDLGSSATSTAACCQLTTTMANEAVRPLDIPGDERFFMTEGAPPNIHFLMDTSGSMKELPQIKKSDHNTFYNRGDTNAADPLHTGCNNTDLTAVQASRAWDPNKVYAQPDLGTGEGSDDGHPNLFLDNKYYAYMDWEDSSSPNVTWHTREDACKAQYGNWATTEAARYNNCLSCLQTKGYFKRPGVNNYNGSTRRNFIFWGRFLNFNPPKYVTAKVVLKQVIKDMRRVRAGVSQFAWDNSNAANNGAAMVRGQNPSCDQIIRDSSSFDSNRGSYINAVDALSFNTGTPLAKALLNIGQYFSSTDDIYRVKFDFDDYVFKSGYRNGSLSAQGRSWCWGCQVSSVIIITDGEPSGDVVPPITKSRIQTRNGGAVTCANVSDCVDDTGQDAMLDDVAKLLATQDLQESSPAQVGDLNTAGPQNMSIYTIGFGIDSKLLANTAKVGEGEYYTANDADALKDAILSIIRAVQTRATSFSSTAVSSLQVNASSGTLVPRFKPSKSTTSPWQGFLYRFSLAPEVLLGCKPAPHPDRTGDLNQDGDCDDIHIMDKDQQAVIEDDQGNFVRLSDGITPAKPFWEAGEKLKPANSVKTTYWRTRRIFTIVDNGGPSGSKDNKIDRHDTPVEFIEENAAALQDYLGISNNPNECATLATRLGLANLSPLDCTKLVIRYYRGADALNSDAAQRGFDRPFLLHDIFHSSPVSVEPPTPKFFCGFANQCLDTLYSGSTVHHQGYVGSDGKKRDAYDELLARRGDRDKIVLVGSNGGLLHAFHNGTKTGLDPATGLMMHDAGTGEELWAFVPPDLLPKLRSQMGQHAYFVDGTPMVRDVWLDGKGADANKDGLKQADEFRTVAVVGTGTGGVHRFALDLTELIRSPNVVSQANHRPPNAKGDFLWMWPQPCDPLATQLGESFSNFTPKPPPIGPVAMADPNGPWKVGAAQTKAREQWIVMLNGGYDPYMVRGRGMAIVDLGTGETLWSFFYGDDTSKRPLANKLRYPMAAGAGMMDMGNALTSAADADLLFDTATIADYGGQVWTVRFWQPGVREGITTGQVTNWFAARSFQVALNATQKSDELLVRPAFSFIPANTVQPETGYMRTFLGTGDRYRLVDYGTQCSLSNPRACAQLGCTVRNSINIQRDSLPVSQNDSSFALTRYVDVLPPTASDAGNACRNPKVTLSWTYGTAGACTARAGKLDYGCTGDATTWTCSSTTSDWVDLKISAPPPAPPATSPNRYYGFWSYGVDPSRRFNTAAEAITFDNKRLYDSDLADVSQFDSTTGAVSATVSASSSLGKGWYVNYVPGAERTGSGSTIIDGCVIWSSFEPSGATSAVCSTTGTNKARTYQAAFVSGKASCAAGFNVNNTTLRYIASSTVAPPPEPAPQRTLINGKVYSSAVVPGVGGGGGSGNQQFIVGQNKEVLQSVYQLEMDQATHECRHGGAGVGCK